MGELIYRREFTQALEVLARVCQAASRAEPAAIPVLVGGAAVEFDTGGRFTSGDFDFVTPSDEAFVRALEQEGFVRDSRRGVLQRSGGWRHPTLHIGVDMVSGALFDGRTSRSRLRSISIGGGVITLPPTEDMIADRLGQWEASGRTDRAMIAQARAMYRLAEGLDPEYLDTRIRQETLGAAGPELFKDDEEGAA